MNYLLTAIKGIDWALLRAQKQELVKMQSVEGISQEQFDTLEGMLGLLDAIQDAAVNDEIATEEEVCGPAWVDPAEKKVEFRLTVTMEPGASETLKNQGIDALHCAQEALLREQTGNTNILIANRQCSPL